jgi:hypothetical protein
MSRPKRLPIRAGKALARNTFGTDLLPLDAIKLDACFPSAPLRQTVGLHEGRISGSS